MARRVCRHASKEIGPYRSLVCRVCGEVLRQGYWWPGMKLREHRSFTTDPDLVETYVGDGDLELRFGTVLVDDWPVEDVAWVETLMGLWRKQPELAVPVIAWLHQDEGQPTELITGSHRLQAAFRLGWERYPAFLVVEPVVVLP